MKTLYFLNKGDLIGESMNVPIKPKQSDWYKEVNPTRMIRSFEFDSYESLMFFVSQTMRFANKIEHHPNITIMGDKSVLVETYTHELNDVSSQDMRIIRMTDQIYRDATYVGEEPEVEQANDDNDERLSERYRFDWTTDW
jgi:pterin-4a-carbinolamine dehydratase